MLIGRRSSRSRHLLLCIATCGGCFMPMGSSVALENLRVRDDVHHCSWSLPSGWQAMPEEVLRFASKTASETTGAPVEYAHGYSRTGNNDWFNYPYILVGFASSMGADLDAIGRALDATETRDAMAEEGSAAGIAPGAHQRIGVDNDPSWRRHGAVALVTRTNSDTQVSVFVSGKNATWLLMFICDTADYSALKTGLLDIVASFRFDPGYEASMRRDFVKKLESALLMAIPFAIALAVLRRVVGRRQNSGPDVS